MSLHYLDMKTAEVCMQKQEEYLEGTHMENDVCGFRRFLCIVCSCFYLSIDLSIDICSTIRGAWARAFIQGRVSSSGRTF